MKRSWYARFTLLILLILGSVYLTIPTLFNFNQDSHYPVKSKINLGLDLQGGLYMILGIDYKKVYKDETKTYLLKSQTVLKDRGIESVVGDTDVSDPLDPKVSIEIQSETQVTEAKNKIKDYYGPTLRLTSENGKKLQYGLGAQTRRTIEEQSISKSIEVIRNRIDEFGVSEPEILSQGNDRIVVQLPGISDVERAKELIGRTAKLEFKIVNDEVNYTTIQEWMKKAKDAKIEFKKGDRLSAYVQKVNEFLKADIPAGNELAFEKKSVSAEANAEEMLMPYLVHSEAKITGDDLQDAHVQIDQQKNQPYVGMDFKTQGAKKFEDVTGNNIGKRMAVILDGNVFTAPNIQGRISGGSAQITLGAGSYEKNLKEARDISLVLRAGALPVQLDFLEQRAIGPSLGQDSIHKAKWASIIGCSLIFIFMMFYYRLSGFIAVITLLINLCLILACLVWVGATLTLPGIAGIALTLGMAVDGNIIIYERIREEIKKGATSRLAVEEGFKHAFWTLIDANITTALAGIALLEFGTGPIRGFAVTLLIGIATTVYTAYFATHIIFEWYMARMKPKTVSI